ncbi:MAG TPA: PLP-dependent aminotransferase family protein [Chitinophagaceae bacterium]|nr:PLP-dependent aminotransferase family protein [Chitinophagaceae bacterium]
MLPFKTLIPINKQSPVAVYMQIANSMVSLIRGGIIKPGVLLPSSREMSDILQVHRKTVVAAYEELYVQDWIETQPRKGVMVSQHLPEIKPRSFRPEKNKHSYMAEAPFAFKRLAPGMPVQAGKQNYRLALNDGFPDARIAPLDLLFKEYRRLFNKSTSPILSMQGDKAGSVRLRTAIAGFLSATRGLNITAGNVLLSRGAQMAIYMAAAMLIKPGSTVIVAEPNYLMANMIFEQFGAKLLRVPADTDGIDVDAIERICRKKKPSLLYVIPHHHHPTTVTLSAERRMKLLQLVRDYDFPIIEDDYDYDFHYNHNPILPLASAHHSGNVIYIGSLTKFLAPSIRVGYMAAPENFIQQVAQLKLMIDIRGDSLLEEALASLSNAGHIQRHLKKSVKLYHQRRDMFCGLLEKELTGIVSFTKPQGGMAVWATFNKKYPLQVIAQRVAEQGLYMSNGSTYNSGNINYNALRMGFASLNENEMSEVVSIIKKAAK